MSRRAVRTVLAVFLAVLLVLGGCALASRLLGEERPGFEAFNASDVTIELTLNGESPDTIEPSSGMAIASTRGMQALPWEVEARTTTGRVVLTMTVTAEDLERTGVKVASVDLPGGRFEVSVRAKPQ